MPLRSRAGKPYGWHWGSSTWHGWGGFLLAVLCIKILFFLLDPIPKLFLGDSGSYLLTAVEDYIPVDRSFTYGYVIRLATFLTGTLTPLLYLQTAASAAAASLLAYGLHRYFHVETPVAFACGLLCALEPLQLLYERYVMAETLSLFFVVLYLLALLHYVQQPRLAMLCLVHSLGLAVVSLRFSFLPLVLANAVLLPLLASWSLAHAAAPGSPARRQAGKWVPRTRVACLVLLHILVSLGTTRALHQGYKQVYGMLSAQAPGYHSADGFMLAAVWAPVIQPEDLPLPALRSQVFDHLAYDLRDRSLREEQLFAYDGLGAKLQEALPTVAEANRVAKVMAINALQRDPLGVVRLAWETAMDYFRLDVIRAKLLSDLAMDESQLSLYRLYHFWYGHYYKLPFVEAQPMTLLKHYYMAALPWFWFLLLVPFVCAAALFCTRGVERRLLLAILLACCAGVASATALAVFPIVRYLHPVAWLAFWPLAILYQACRRAPAASR